MFRYPIIRVQEHLDCIIYKLVIRICNQEPFAFRYSYGIYECFELTFIGLLNEVDVKIFFFLPLTDQIGSAIL